MKVIPIIVAFPIKGESLEKVHELNEKCNLDKGIDFRFVIPHLTLWMGFVDEAKVSVLKDEFEKVFKNVSTSLVISSLDLFQGVEGTVLSVSISSNRYLELLQNRIHHFFEPFRHLPSSFTNMNEVTINYINGFSEKSLEFYDPHITIGFSDELFELTFDRFRVAEPKMFLAGNNCTCIAHID